MGEQWSGGFPGSQGERCLPSLSQTTPAHTSPLCCKTAGEPTLFPGPVLGPLSILSPRLRVIKAAGLVSDPTWKEGY